MTSSALALLSREGGLPDERFHADAFVPVAELVRRCLIEILRREC